MNMDNDLKLAVDASIKAGEVIMQYYCADYEIKEKGSFSYLWAVDSRTNTIKSFKIDNIKNARLLPQTFQPRTF